MGRRWTKAEIVRKIQRDIDLEAEDFVTPDELDDIINEGIDECEAHIHRLGREDDYFLTRTVLNMVVTENRISLPENIYANKIRGLTYSNGSTIYQVSRMRGMHKFERIARIEQYNNSTDYYRFLILHDSVDDNYEMEIYPAARESGAFLQMYYIRNANRLVDNDDVCDIPEFVYYVIDFAKYEILKKEGHVMAAEAEKKLMKQEARMIQTLEDMVPDEDNTIFKDMEHYEDMT